MEGCVFGLLCRALVGIGSSKGFCATTLDELEVDTGGGGDGPGRSSARVFFCWQEKVHLKKVNNQQLQFLIIFVTKFPNL